MSELTAVDMGGWAEVHMVVGGWEGGRVAGGAKDAGTKYGVHRYLGGWWWVGSVFIPGKRGCGMRRDWTYTVVKSKRRNHQHWFTPKGGDDCHRSAGG